MKWSTRSHRRHNAASNIDGEEPTTISINASPQTSSQANRIYFYSEITSETVLELNKQIDEAARQMLILKITLDLNEAPPIKLHINSPGGDVGSSFCAADKIRNCPVPIHTYCEGEVASGATMISVSGKKRFITKNSFFLIHQLSAEYWGKYTELKDQMENLDMMMASIKKIYLEKTKIPKKELDVLLKHDLYISPEVCLEWGFVDEII